MAFTKVIGKVSEVVNESYPRIKLWETYDFRGEPRNRLWTVWLDGSSDLVKEDEVEVTGDLGTKVGTYNKPGQDTKQVVEHSLNNAIVKVLKKAEPKAPSIQQIADILEPVPPVPGEHDGLPF